MNTKPTYQELEHRVKELEKKSFQHQQTEEALKRITDEQAVLLSAVPAMIFWIDKEGNFIRVNEPFAAALKKSPDEINGKSLFDLYPEDQATKYHSDNLEVIESDKPKKNVEERVQTPAGTMWVFTDKIPYRDKEGNNVGIIGFSVDITDLKRAEEALRESEEIYRSLSNNIPGMVYRGRPDWSTEVISNSEDICGHSAEEFNSQKINWLDIIHPDDKERVLDETVELEKKHMNIVQEYRIIDKGGSIRWVEDHKSSRFKKEGIFQGVDGVVFDITEHKQTEEERRKLEAQLHQALKMEAIGTLAGGIAHDFNNVLMGIQGHMSLALLYADSGRPHSEHLKGIEDMVKRGGRSYETTSRFCQGRQIRGQTD
ncbi:MAG: PAS domain S-box protein [Deltaproteobacteria bacterium]|nr:PAS domain S-box protein [Deltaproteobacteria bacterium]MBW1795113.1 PAS domain S-box protein [Deltaproteobacteria bacterium]MBW2331357.1 PAS domain S-box protein [Deltaproteobacteria bacterium]